MSNLSPNIFNVEKSDYETAPLFLGQPAGLLDSVNKRYPDVWKSYKTVKSLDWDENEFPFLTCNVEFKTVPKNVYEMMIRTLAWQWEADSVAARSIAPLLACFQPNTELWSAYSEVQTNEIVHGLTYSEIVRSSFDKPNEVLGDILKVKESLERMETVSAVFHKAYVTGHKFALGMVENDQETYNDAYMLFVAMLCMERLQFLASFAITFCIAKADMFVPIGKAVQKIAQDELEVHAVLAKQVLAHENKTDRGRLARQQCDAVIRKLITDVVNGELKWSEYLFSEGRELTGMNVELLKKWVLYNARDVYMFFGIDLPADYDFPTKNPLKFIEEFLDISKTQPAPQEQANGQYKVNIMRRDDEAKKFDVEF